MKSFKPDTSKSMKSSASAAQLKLPGARGKGYEARTSYPQAPVQQKETVGSLPAKLAQGIEQASGFAMKDVQVHYNSDQPAQLHALAFAQGTHLHLGPGQEAHLPHEAWHVVQQKQGRVKPTRSEGQVSINDSNVLEHEADTMQSTLLLANGSPQTVISKPGKSMPGNQPAQLQRGNKQSKKAAPKAAVKKADEDRVTSFPHKGKHCPPPGAVNKPKVLEQQTATKGKAALYKTNDISTVVGWEDQARANGLVLADNFTIIHAFNHEIGADQGDMTKFIRIDGDHGHPINESAGKQSFNSYLKGDIAEAVKAGNTGRVRIIAEWVKARGLNYDYYVSKEAQKMIS